MLFSQIKILVEKEFNNMIEEKWKKSEVYYVSIGHLAWGYSTAYLRALYKDILNSVFEIESKIKILTSEYLIQEKLEFEKIKKELDNNRSILYSKADHCCSEIVFTPYNDKSELCEKIKNNFIKKLLDIRDKFDDELSSILADVQKNKNIFFKIWEWFLQHVLGIIGLAISLLGYFKSS